jgi:hypothetical protein
VNAARASSTKRPHGNTGGEQLQKAARKQGHGQPAGERVDVLFRAAGAAGGAVDGSVGRASRYSLRPAAAQQAETQAEMEAEAEGERARAGWPARRVAGASFVGARVAVPFELGSAVVYMLGHVISAEDGSYSVRYVDGDVRPISKAALLAGAEDYRTYSLRSNGTFIGTRADAERAYAAAGGQAPPLPEEPTATTTPGAAQARPRRSQQAGASGSSPAVNKRQLDTAQALRLMAARGARPFVPAAPPRGSAARRAIRCALVAIACMLRAAS